MSKIGLATLASLTAEQSALTTLNSNSAVVQTAFDNTLSRDGTSPNTMQSQLDMNSYRILNVPEPREMGDPLRLQDLSNFIGGSLVIHDVPTGGTTGQTLQKLSNTNYDIGWQTISITGVTSARQILTTAPLAGGGDLSADRTISITGSVGKVLAGAAPSFTSTPTLGQSGTLGNISFGNATSGLVTIQPVAGALGTVTMSIPAATDTFVGRATTDTLTNKTFDTAGAGNSFLINSLAATANTGTGSVVRATSPTLVTPTLGAATVTSVNGLTITNSTGTLTITNGKTVSIANTITINAVDGKSLNLNNSLTFAGTDATTITFQGTDTYVGRATTDSLTNKTYNGLTLSTTTGTFTLTNAKTFSVSNTLTLVGADGTTLTFQGTDTYVGRATTDTLTNKTFDTAGAGNVFKINTNTVSAVTGTGSTAVLSASPTLTGTLIVPTIAGGTAANTTFVIESTTGSGTTDTISFRTGSQVEAGNINTTQQWAMGPGNLTTPAANVILTLNKNATSPITPPVGTLLHVIGIDNAKANLCFDGFGTSAYPGFNYRQARGTLSAPTASTSGDTIGFIQFSGYNSNSAAFSNFLSGSGASILGVAAETMSGANTWGHHLDIKTTPTSAGQTAVVTARFQASGGFSVGVTTDPGIGAILANKSITAHNATAIPAGGTAGSGYLLSSTSNFGMFFGSGAPTLSAAQGSVYLRSDGSSTSTRMYINTNGATTWTNVTTAA